MPSLSVIRNIFLYPMYRKEEFARNVRELQGMPDTIVSVLLGGTDSTKNDEVFRKLKHLVLPKSLFGPLYMGSENLKNHFIRVEIQSR